MASPSLGHMMYVRGGAARGKDFRLHFKVVVAVHFERSLQAKREEKENFIIVKSRFVLLVCNCCKVKTPPTAAACTMPTAIIALSVFFNSQAAVTHKHFVPGKKKSHYSDS